MKKNYLFPQVFKRVGLWFFIPFAVMGIGCLFGNGWWGISSSEGFFSSGLYEYFPTIAIAGHCGQPSSDMFLAREGRRRICERPSLPHARMVCHKRLSGTHSRGFVHLRYGVPHFHVRKHVHGTGALRRGI